MKADVLARDGQGAQVRFAGTLEEILTLVELFVPGGLLAVWDELGSEGEWTTITLFITAAEETRGDAIAEVMRQVYIKMAEGLT